MSHTFSLVCAETKQKLWVGQSGGSPDGMGNFYSAMNSKMKKLGRFLEATRGKQLVLMNDESLVDLDYEEFEGEDAPTVGIEVSTDGSSTIQLLVARAEQRVKSKL